MIFDGFGETKRAKKLVLACPVYNQHKVTKEFLKSCINAKSIDEVWIHDNGSNPPIHSSHKKIDITRSEENEYVNPVWNEFIKRARKEDVDILIIANNDITFPPELIDYIKEIYTNQKMILSTDYKRVKKLTQKFRNLGFKHEECESMIGCFFAMTKPVLDEVPLIPSDLRVWYGDTWISKWADQLEFKKYRISYDSKSLEVSKVLNHLTSKTINSDIRKEIQLVVKIDKMAWGKYHKAITSNEFKITPNSIDSTSFIKKGN